MFWERFVQECEKKGLKPNPAAKEMGISSASVTKWSNGVIPRGNTLDKIASYFGVSTDYLLGKTNNPLPQSAQMPTLRAEYPTNIRQTPKRRLL